MNKKLVLLGMLTLFVGYVQGMDSIFSFDQERPLSAEQVLDILENEASVDDLKELTRSVSSDTELYCDDLNDDTQEKVTTVRVSKKKKRKHGMCEQRTNGVACPWVGCMKKFACKSKVQRHLVIHTKERPYTCACCQKKFNQRSALKTHIIRHRESASLSEEQLQMLIGGIVKNSIPKVNELMKLV